MGSIDSISNISFDFKKNFLQNTENSFSFTGAGRNINLSAAEGAFSSALINKTEKELDKNIEENQLTSISNNFKTAQGEYLNYSGMLDQAKAVSDSLSTQSASLLSQLTKSDAKIAGLNTQRDAAQTEVNSIKTTKSGIEQQKSLQLTNLGRQKGSVNSSISNVSGKLSAAQSEAAMPAADGSENTAAKALVSALQSQLASLKENLNKINQEISETTKDYNQKINEQEQKLNKAEANFNKISNELNQELVVNNGISLESAQVTQTLKEAQVYERSVETLLTTAEAKMNKLEAEEKLQQEKTTEKKNVFATASNYTIEKEKELMERKQQAQLEEQKQQQQ
ncbi:MAG: hypothetical protein PHX18_00130 [Candidatus Gastranaerophilales bacterium]|nr:hypothetical protein [Candidatus Gastranaerophilales bacterium]